MELLILLAQIIGVIVILILPLVIVMFALVLGALYHLIHFVYSTLAGRRM